METSNQGIVDRFFAAFGKHDLAALREVVSEDAKWYFLGRHPLAGIKRGPEEILAFFETMGGIMKESRPTVEKPIVAENGNHLIECVHTRTNRSGGPNVDHHACVLWTFADGKIVEGRHFFADPEAVDRYFTAVAPAMAG